MASSIVVDASEPAGMDEHLRTAGARVERRRLEAGDYAIGTWLVERKTGPDALASLDSGRLADQMARVRAAAPRPALLLEGPVAATPRLDAYLVRCQVQGVCVLRTNDSRHTARLLEWLARPTTELDDERRVFQTQGVHVRKSSNASAGERQSRALQAAGGIGQALARKLLRGRSLRSVAQMSAQELAAACPGLGPKRAASVAGLFAETSALP